MPLDKQQLPLDYFENGGDLPTYDDAMSRYPDQREKNAARIEKIKAQMDKVQGKVKKAADKTLYVHRPLLNGDQVRAWAASQGIASTLPAGDMHVTIAFSREPVDWSSLTPDQGTLTAVGGTRFAHQFAPKAKDNGALVLRFESPALDARWKAFCDAGASWDFPEYSPHITLTYSVPEVDTASIQPYEGPLVFGPEEFGEVNDG